MDKELLEYLENMTEQEQEIIKNNRPVLSYFTKAEGSTVIDSDVVMKPMTMIDIMKQPRLFPCRTTLIITWRLFIWAAVPRLM